MQNREKENDEREGNESCSINNDFAQRDYSFGLITREGEREREKLKNREKQVNFVNKILKGVTANNNNNKSEKRKEKKIEGVRKRERESEMTKNRERERVL